MELREGTLRVNGSILCFRSHVAPMWSWMDKVQPSLDKSEPVHGDIATVEQLIDIHDVRLVIMLIHTEWFILMAVGLEGFIIATHCSDDSL